MTTCSSLINDTRATYFSCHYKIHDPVYATYTYARSQEKEPDYAPGASSVHDLIDENFAHLEDLVTVHLHRFYSRDLPIVALSSQGATSTKFSIEVLDPSALLCYDSLYSRRPAKWSFEASSFFRSIPCSLQKSIEHTPCTVSFDKRSLP